MATFDFAAPSEISAGLGRLEKGEMLDKMLEAGAKVMASAISSHKTYTDRTGSLSKSLSPSKAYRTKKGSVNANARYRGYDSKGAPEPLKANAINARRPWVASAVRGAEGSISSAMLAVQEEYLRGLE